jgi:hypothetical protein
LEVKEVAGAHQAVMGWGVVFGEVVSQNVSAAAPVNKELALTDAVPDPVEALLDGATGNADGTFVVQLDGSGVPAFGGMWGPGATCGGLLVDKNLGARRCKGNAVEIESTVDLGPGREVWVETGTAK